MPASACSTLLSPRARHVPLRVLTRARSLLARSNFMSYRDAEIADPGTRLNCIVGPNGTGKSSIVCAMCVGLGGPLKITGRGDQIKACVHGEGKTPDGNGGVIRAGFVETELVDGNGPGRNLIVRLDFDVENKKYWKLDGSKATEKEVKERMARLNIQVDNPLQFLPQDKVGEFSNMSPVRLLEHTEMAIGPATHEKHQRLIEDDKELVVVKQRLATESKSLDDLAAMNRQLEGDVQRFKQLQENKKKLDAYRGKVAWVEANVLLGKVDEAKAAHAAVEGELKEVKNEVKTREAACKPAEDAKAAFEAELKKVNKKHTEADQERVKLAAPLQKLVEKQDELIDQIGQLDKQKEKKLKKVADAQAVVDEQEKKLEAQKAQLAQQDGRDPKAVHAELQQRVQETTTAARRAQEEHREHSGGEAELTREVHRADAKLKEIEDAKVRKMNLVMQHNKDAAQAGHWAEARAPEHVRDNIVGPLLMHIDVPEPSHQKLAEEAIGPKLAFSGFLATSDEARSEMTKAVQSHKWKVNVYKNSEGTFRPCKRPPSESMKKFGVTAWLDEALTIPPTHRDAILSSLKDLAQVDKYLLATAKTVSCIEQLQKHLADAGMDMVTILTPERKYRVSRSRYGDKVLNSITEAPKANLGLYRLGVDDSQKNQLAAEKEAALQAHAAFKQTEKDLFARAQAAGDEKAEASAALSAFNQGKASLAQLQARLEVFQGRLKDFTQDAEGFDVTTQREKLSKALTEAAKKEVDISGAIAAATAKMVDLRGQECAASIAWSAAKHALAEASEAVAELKQALDEKKRAKEEADRVLKEAMKTHADKASFARKIAPSLEKDKSSGLRSAAAQATWDSMPNDFDELDSKIAELQEEIDASDDDGGKTLKDYEQRLRDIEAGKEKVAATQEEVSDKQKALDLLTAEWKPELERLVSVVNDNFGEYFKRFKCCGEVSLADGRKTNPQTGQQEGADDFSQYKILIKVQWRNTEELHVLGEGGRDSGGERSVATMVYLISLQNINPAPFRVVDEINQAMDSTNERHVFECITHACKEGGKQYFLLTPKLLPDLEYGEETAIQLVFNGPYNVTRESLTLADWA